MRKNVSTSKRVTIELRFLDQPAIIEGPKGVFRGGVPDPTLSDHFGFNVLPLSKQDYGEFGPAPGGASYDGALQVNLVGGAADFRELGRYFLAIAELDTRADPGFHQHHDALRSVDGRTTIDLIVRKIHS